MTPLGIRDKPGTRSAQRFRLRIIAVTLLLFAALVAAKVHGSSLAQGAVVWDATAHDHYVASPVLAKMETSTAAKWRPWLMAESASVRADEYGQATPWAFAQIIHDPPFPVVNTNMGNGQNMLMVPSVPVWHLSAIARPVTWGYLMFGAEFGLAWSWWFQPLACFLGLVLLFELVVPDRRWLGVFGAAWYCSSAYVIAWSLWPANYTALGAFATVCGYRLCQTNRPRVMMVAGVGLGVSFSGFAILLYPPWQVPLGLCFLTMLVALFVRDGLHRRLLENRWRLVALAVAVAVVVGIMGSFVASSSEAISALIHSSYPGERRLLGGDCTAPRLFGAFYNFYTNTVPTPLLNRSEAAGFFLLFPGVIVAGLVSSRIRRDIGIVGWVLAGLAVFFVYFCVFPIPSWLASATMMSRVQGFRAQIAIGLVSITLCLLLIDAAQKQGAFNSRAMWTGVTVFLCSAALYLWLGWEYQQRHHVVPGEGMPGIIIAIALLAAGTVALMTLGMTRLVAVIVLCCTTITSWHFNPLSRGFAPVLETELGQAISRVVALDVRDDEGRSGLWLTYGWPRYPNPGTVAQMMGARALSGVHHHPQLELWRPLDPTGAQHFKYNRYAQVLLSTLPLRDLRVIFQLPVYLMINLYVSPLHPGLRTMGARYALTFGPVAHIKAPPFTVLYRSPSHAFTIWRLPD